jgi:hypothetical protein
MSPNFLSPSLVDFDNTKLIDDKLYDALVDVSDRTSMLSRGARDISPHRRPGLSEARRPSQIGRVTAKTWRTSCVNRRFECSVGGLCWIARTMAALAYHTIMYAPSAKINFDISRRIHMRPSLVWGSPGGSAILYERNHIVTRVRAYINVTLSLMR